MSETWYYVGSGVMAAVSTGVGLYHRYLALEAQNDQAKLRAEMKDAINEVLRTLSELKLDIAEARNKDMEERARRREVDGQDRAREREADGKSRAEEIDKLKEWIDGSFVREREVAARLKAVEDRVVKVEVHAHPS